MRQHQRPTPLGGEMTATLGHRLGVLPLGDVDGPRRCFASKGGQKIYRCDYVFFTQNYCDFCLKGRTFCAPVEPPRFWAHKAAPSLKCICFLRKRSLWAIPAVQFGRPFSGRPCSKKSTLFWCLGARRSKLFSEMHNADAAQAAKADKRFMRLNGSNVHRSRVKSTARRGDALPSTSSRWRWPSPRHEHAAAHEPGECRNHHRLVPPCSHCCCNS